MNASVHAELSCKRAGTKSQVDFDFFYKIHDFMDSSKEIESSNLHRFIFHHIFGIKRFVIPIFGHSYTCENGKVINIKDDLENHLYEDNRFKFVASLDDYVSLIKEDEKDEEIFASFYKENVDLFSRKEVKNLMFAPLYNTNKIKSLWLTHNSWFLNEVLIKIFKEKNFKEFKCEKMAPSIVFNRMIHEEWINNGKSGFPPSFAKIMETNKTNMKVIFDGSPKPKDLVFSPPITEVEKMKPWDNKMLD